jgi:hypothetical protein
MVIKPNFFIVGAPKCGTTAMNDYLSDHPDIFMAPKEIHYFGADLKMKQQLTEAEYLDFFKEAGNKKIIGEASVWYLFSRTAAKEIKSFSPGSKILIMLRNPIQVLPSLHSQHLYDGNEVETDFETAINLDNERKQGKQLPDSVDYHELPPYIDSVLFAEQVERYLTVFGKQNVHIILFDDFVENTPKAVLGVLQFLGLEENHSSEYKVVNPGKSIRFFPLHRMIKKPPVALRKVIRFLLPFKKLRHQIMHSLSQWNTGGRKRHKTDYRLNERLKEEVAADIEKLGKIIDRDLTAWL